MKDGIDATPNRPDEFFCKDCGCPLPIGEKCHCESDGDGSPEGAARRLLEFMGNPLELDMDKIKATGEKLISMCHDSGLTFTEQLYLLDKAAESLRETLQRYTHEILGKSGIAIAEVLVSKDTGEIAEITPLDPTVKLDPSKLEEIKSRLKPQVDAAVAELLTRQTKATSKPSPDSFQVSKGGRA